MDFIVNKYSMTGFDGRRILRLIIYKPIDSGDLASRYLCEYAKNCEKFAREKLYPALQNKYIREFDPSERSNPTTYSLEITETFADERYSSYLVVARIFSTTDALATGIDSVIFSDKGIIPPKLLSRKRKSDNSVFILDKDCRVARISAVNNELTVSRTSGKRIAL